MSSTPHQSSSRIWWPLSSRLSTATKPDKRRPPSQEKPPHDAQKQSGVTFTTFASAIGFKTRKHPSLTIQEPPVSTQLDSSKALLQQPPRYANRPPSKSVSSTLRSSLEPRTPSDAPRDPLAFRQSLLTLSDDPFASRGISSVSGAQDPNRLSLYCNFSMSDDMSKRKDAVSVLTNEDRSSCMSMSSDSWPRRPITSPSDYSYRSPLLSETQSVRRAKKSSDASLGRPGEGIVQGGRGNREDPPVNRTQSLCASAAIARRSNPTSPSRPPMRARGMTDADSRLKFLRRNDTPFDAFSPPPSPLRPLLSRKPSRPRVLVRQASSSRVGLPPSAPPTHDLPAPPVRVEGNQPYVVLPEDSRYLSSCMSFASSLSSEKGVHFPRQYRNTYESDQASEHSTSRLDMDPRGSSAGRVDTTSLTLKKASSHQSLGRRGLSDSKSVPVCSTEGLDRVPRKQRSFHRQWLPMPPVPSADTTEKLRRDSASGYSSLGRKRLFSGSSHRRPSTSAADGDMRSVFSLPLESDRAKPASLSKPLSTSSVQVNSSFWDEGTTDCPSSPVSSTRDYTPQQIMSPAEMLRVEASFQEEQSFHNDSYSRSRDTSISISTSDTFLSDYSPAGLSPPSTKRGLSERGGILKPGRLRGLSTLSSSAMARELAAPYLDARPSTSESYMSPPSGISLSPTSSYYPEPVSLPPPPPRHQLRPPSTFSALPDRSSFVPIIPLSPPPLRRNHLLTKPPVETVGQRQSLMRKPSFLEIEDDMHVDKPSVNSFLDLNRGSLDTVRSMDYSYSDDD